MIAVAGDLDDVVDVVDDRRDVDPRQGLLDLVLLPAQGAVQELRQNGDADHPALLGQGLEHLVAEVAVMGRKRPAGRMRGHDRRLRVFQHVPERRIRGVRDVDDHAEPVHLGHDLPAELGQAAVDRLRIARRVGPIGRRPVGQGHEPHARPVELAQHGQVVLDGVAALDADDDRRLALVVSRGGVPGREGQGESVRVLVDEVVHALDLGEDLVRRRVFLEVVRRRRGEAGEDLEVDAAPLELGDVDVARRQVLGQVLAGHVPADRVAVHVDDRGLAVEEERPEEGIVQVLLRRPQVPDDVAVVLGRLAQPLGIDHPRPVAGHVIFGVLVVELLGQDLAGAQADGRDVLRPERGVVRAAVVVARPQLGDRRRVEPLLDDLVKLGELGHAADKKVAVAGPDHVDVHVERRLVEGPDRMLGVIARAHEAQFLAGPRAEDDRPGRPELGRREGPGRFEHGRGRGGVVVGAGVDPAVDADAEVVEVAAHDERLALELRVRAGQDADDVGRGPVLRDEVGLHLGLDAEIERERLFQPERLADEVAPAFPDEVERVAEEVAAGPHDDEAFGALAGIEQAGPQAARSRRGGLTIIDRRRDVHLDEADGSLVRGGPDFPGQVPARLGIGGHGFGDVGHDQDDLALDVEPRIVVPAVLPGDDAAADEDHAAAHGAGPGPPHGGEVPLASGEIDAVGGSEDLEADGLHEIAPGLERDLLEPGAVVAAGLEADLLHLGRDVFGGAPVFGRAGFPPLHLVRRQESDVGEGLGAVGRGAKRRGLGGAAAHAPHAPSARRRSGCGGREQIGDKSHAPDDHGEERRRGPVRGAA